MSQKQLYRSLKDRRIAGIAGGLAEYFQVDSTMVRLLWLLSIFIGGGGVLAYLIAWIVIPEKPLTTESEITDIDTENSEIKAENNNNFEYQKRYNLLGILLIVVGLFFLMKQFLPWDLSRYIWPFILIALGIVLLIPRQKSN